MDLDFQLFKGASIQFKDVANAAERAEQVAALPAVKNLWPVHMYSIPEHTVHSVGAPGAAEYQKRADAANDTFTPHVMTQVNKLRDEGITGKGIKIAVVDTGVSLPLSIWMTHGPVVRISSRG
jgi:subtilisin family serine protease